VTHQVFADTSFYMALLNERDQWHEAAVRESLEMRQPVLLTEFILIELGNTIHGEQTREQYVQFVRQMTSDPLCRIVPASSALVTRGLDLFARRLDKDWSLTDCISFVVMREHGVTEALTTDRHFEQAGFRILLA